MTHPIQRIIDLAIAALLGGGMFAVGRFALHNPLDLALFTAVACICLLPVAQAFLPVSSSNHRQECLCHNRYAVAVLPILIGLGLVAGPLTAIVLTAVALSLIGGASLLAAFRLPASYAIALTVLGAAISFTWPIWAANLLLANDLGPWLQRVVDISPAFAINAAISPDDAITHRPIAYRLMNLGQDISYAMPASIWPCVVLHAVVGLLGLVVGLVARSITQPRASTVVAA